MSCFRLYHGKCAYCESTLFASAGWDQLDHFRPKNKVLDERNRTVRIDGKPHTWLTYLARLRVGPNLLPFLCGLQPA